MLKHIEIGEIIIIKEKEYLVIETQIGNSVNKRINLISLKKIFKKSERDPNFKWNWEK